MASAPFLIPQSSDPLDTRPNTSGAVPATHYNVPMYQQLPTQAHDPLVGALVNTLSGGAYNHPSQTLPYWKGVASSFDPRTPTGIANLAGILIPGGKNWRGQPSGYPSGAQENFLAAIKQSSTGQHWPAYPHNAAREPTYDISDPGVAALMQHLGTPPGARTARDVATASNAFEGIQRQQGDLGFSNEMPGYKGPRPEDLMPNDTRELLRYLLELRNIKPGTGGN